MNSDAIESILRESEKRQLSELRIRVEAARDRADNADVAAQAAVELAESWRREAEAHRESLDECERHGISYRQEIADLRAAAQYVLAQHGYGSPSLAALGKLLAGEERPS